MIGFVQCFETTLPISSSQVQKMRRAPNSTIHIIKSLIIIDSLLTSRFSHERFPMSERSFCVKGS